MYSIVVNEADDVIAWAEVVGDIALANSIFVTEIPKDDLIFYKYINGQFVYSQARKDQFELDNLRAERTMEFNKYDKYQLPYVQSSLTTEQIQEYNEWRNAWLDVTITKEIPLRPIWFS